MQKLNHYNPIKPALWLLFAFVIAAFAAPEKGHVQKLILEEQKVEGKIRRPQLVLIKADQRPSFPPMANQSFGNNPDITSFVDPQVLDFVPNNGPFKFKNKAIVNYLP
ncbi:MAG: hypothetical protein PHC61_15075 [Chitinivibrionales bacterium]|nr:hypothetical protein [Chitinivibrionales bacterium]